MGGRAVRGLVIAVLVVIVLLAVADRVGVVVAEHAAADTIQSSQHLQHRPDVDIAGFPFLTQLATGHYDKITVTAADVPVTQGAGVTISRLVVVLHTLTASRDFAHLHAKTASATATLSYAELGRRLGVALRYAGDGRIVASKTVTLAGQSITGRVRARPQVVNGALAFADTSVDNAGELGAGVAALLARTYDLSIPLQGIPLQVRVAGLRAEASGVVITLVGHDISYST